MQSNAPNDTESIAGMLSPDEVDDMNLPKPSLIASATAALSTVLGSDGLSDRRRGRRPRSAGPDVLDPRSAGPARIAHFHPSAFILSSSGPILSLHILYICPIMPAVDGTWSGL